MTTTKMLIDARHAEETRVVVQNGKRVDDFEFESAARRQLKGNIYLAKVTRVEPSLQAAFVDYGGNRHGFLAFSEIHPDYYQIPTEDRQALLEAQRAELSDDDGESDEAIEAEAVKAEESEDGVQETGDSGEEEAQEKIRSKRSNMRRRYKIQEVIKKRQVLLVQIVKEERGNKGAALTTYLSLAGRYCVLMPNSTHGGGISRKISSAADRKRLRTIMNELKLPQAMGCIIRTAGMSRTKTEIKRDFDYLFRLWEGIREQTLKSIAPDLIYEEGNLIKRSIRDLYSREIEEVQVDGEAGYKTAKAFMKLLMPSHAKKVIQYKERAPLFQAAHVDEQLDTIFSPTVQLKSGGYIVINPTEALVSIDVNSGKSTKEHNIEETAVRTNLEAADEVARQLRLRDMAGLIVIDFIDMEDRGNNRSVERRMKDALKNDRARVQVGRISQFGLLEMSRQRLRPGMLEAVTDPCPHCNGTGIIRNVGSSALQALRAIEEAAANCDAGATLRASVHTDIALYLLNEKRALINEVESTNEVSVEVRGDNTLMASDHVIERVEVDDNGDERTIATQPNRLSAAAFAPEDEGKGRKKRRRRGRGRGRQDDNGADSSEEENTAEDSAEAPVEASSDDSEKDERPRKRRRRGRRGGRGRKDAENVEATVEADSAHTATPESEAAEPQKTEETAASEEPGPAEAEQETVEAAPKRRRVRRKKAEPVEEEANADAPAEEATESKEAAPAEKPKRTRRKPSTRKPKAKAEEPAAAQEAAPAAPEEEAAPAQAEAEPDAAPAPEPVSPDAVKAKRPARKSFWQRAFDRN